MKKVFSVFAFLLSLLFLVPQSAFADGTFTASNYSYNSTTKELTFDLSNISGPIQFASGYVAIVDPSVSDTVGAATDGGTNFSCDTSHCDVTLNYAFDLTFNPSTDYMISIYDSNNGYYSSQTINFSSPTPTPTPAIKIVADPSSANTTVGTPFNVDVKVTDNSSAFNAAQATVAVSSNLSVTGIHAPSSNACSLQYTKHPKPSDPSFAGAIFGSSSTGCTVYTMTLTPTSTGTGTVIFTNGSIKAYSDNSEILTGVQNGSFAIADGPTPTPTAGVPQLTITSPLLTYLTSYTLAGGKDTSISHVFINTSESGVTFPTSTTWQKSETLSLGDNTYTIYGTDDSSNQTATQTIDVNRHTLGDINGDGNVDLIDASLFAVDFGKTSNLTYILSDMNGDGNADLADLSILAKLEE